MKKALLSEPEAAHAAAEVGADLQILHLSLSDSVPEWNRAKQSFFILSLPIPVRSKSFASSTHPDSGFPKDLSPVLSLSDCIYMRVALFGNLPAEAQRSCITQDFLGGASDGSASWDEFIEPRCLAVTPAIPALPCICSVKSHMRRLSRAADIPQLCLYRPRCSRAYCSALPRQGQCSALVTCKCRLEARWQGAAAEPAAAAASHREARPHGGSCSSSAGSSLTRGQGLQRDLPMQHNASDASFERVWTLL